MYIYTYFWFIFVDMLVITDNWLGSTILQGPTLLVKAKGISPKGNVIVRLAFELAYFEAAVEH